MATINGVTVMGAREVKVRRDDWALRRPWLPWVMCGLISLLGLLCFWFHEAERAADLREARFDAAFQKELRRLEREAMEAGPLEFYVGSDGERHIVGTPQAILDAAAARKRANVGPVAERSAWSDEVQREAVRELRRPYPTGGAPVVPYP